MKSCGAWRRSAINTGGSAEAVVLREGKITLGAKRATALTLTYFHASHVLRGTRGGDEETHE